MYVHFPLVFPTGSLHKYRTSQDFLGFWVSKQTKPSALNGRSRFKEWPSCSLRFLKDLVQCNLYSIQLSLPNLCRCVCRSVTFAKPHNEASGQEGFSLWDTQVCIESVAAEVTFCKFASKTISVVAPLVSFEVRQCSLLNNSNLFTI